MVLQPERKNAFVMGKEVFLEVSSVRQATSTVFTDQVIQEIARFTSEVIRGAAERLAVTYNTSGQYAPFAAAT
jgi:hypothetical protein